VSWPAPRNIPSWVNTLAGIEYQMMIHSKRTLVVILADRSKRRFNCHQLRALSRGRPGLTMEVATPAPHGPRHSLNLTPKLIGAFIAFTSAQLFLRGGIHPVGETSSLDEKRCPCRANGRASWPKLTKPGQTAATASAPLSHPSVEASCL
jgi:hypothetical protein